MEVYVGILPASTTQSEVMRLLVPFDKQVRVEMKTHELREGGKNHYAVATFSSDKTALKAIKKLNETEFHGCILEVREYLYRSYNNERRALGWRNQAWDGEERRQHERRAGTTIKAGKDDDLFMEIVEEESTEGEEKITIQGYRDLATKQS